MTGSARIKPPSMERMLAMDLLAAGSIGYLEPAGGFSAEHALWQRILRSASTVVTGINRLNRALETS